MARNRLNDPPTWLKVPTTLGKPPNPNHLCLQATNSHGIDYIEYRAVSSMRNDFKYLDHLSMKKLQKMQMYFDTFLNIIQHIRGSIIRVKVLVPSWFIWQATNMDPLIGLSEWDFSFNFDNIGNHISLNGDRWNFYVPSIMVRWHVVPRGAHEYLGSSWISR